MNNIKTITTYHLFGDGWDEWFENIDTAKREYKTACSENTNVRLYENTSEMNGDTVEENYLMGQGKFPY